MDQKIDAYGGPGIQAFTVRCFLIFLLAGRAFSQNTGNQNAFVKPAFQIADVRVSPRRLSSQKMEGGVVRSGRYELRQATMLDLIATAYHVDPETVFGGPPWLEFDRFDVIAKVPPDTSPETARAMLQDLLANRFHLAAHKDTKTVRGFALSVARGGPKLKPADAAATTSCQASTAASEPGIPPYNVAGCRNITLEGFAAALRGLASIYITGPVVDATAIKGKWDFDFNWMDRRALTSASTDITIFDALNKQLGLMLEQKDVRAPVLVVDQVNQKPTANLPDTAALLPPALEFEAASIRPTAPGTPPGGGGFLPGGRVVMRSTPLALLLLTAWDSYLPPDEIPGAPKWLQPFEPAFDLVAKAPDSATVNGTQLYSGDYQMMLQKLLIERFQMVTHYEERPMDTYVLVAAKPKLKKAAPLSRTRCRTTRSANPGSAGDIIGLASMVQCQNMTMTQFAQELHVIAGAYLHHSILDATAITGAWDFTFTFTTLPGDLLERRAAGNRRGDSAPAAGSTDGPPDPVGGISLFDALSKQLGLKLEIRKLPQSTLVIDHVEQKPTDN